MSLDIPRYIVESVGPDIEAAKVAFQGVYQICTQQNISEITLLVPVKNTLDTSVIEELLGEGVIKALRKGERVTFADGLNIFLESQRTFKSYKSYGMLMGIYLPPEGLNILDSVVNAKAIIFLPWLEDEGKNWKNTWDATTIGKKIWQITPSLLDPTVEEELLRLTQIINLSTGLSHPSDKKSAQQIFLTLKKHRHYPDVESIRQWALRHNWSPNNAEELKKLAQRYFGK